MATKSQPFRLTGRLLDATLIEQLDQMIQELYEGAGGGGGSVIVGEDMTKTDDTNVTLTFVGTPLGSLLNAVRLVLGWTGLLSTARGGLGSDGSAVTNGQIPIGRTSDHTYQPATLTAGAGISITNGASAITIAAPPANFEAYISLRVL